MTTGVGDGVTGVSVGAGVSAGTGVGERGTAVGVSVDGPVVAVGVGVSAEGPVAVGAGVSVEGVAAVGVGVSSPSQAANKTIAAVSPTTASRMMRRLPSPPTFFSLSQDAPAAGCCDRLPSQPNAPVRSGLLPSID